MDLLEESGMGGVGGASYTDTLLSHTGSFNLSLFCMSRPASGFFQGKTREIASENKKRNRQLDARMENDVITIVRSKVKVINTQVTNQTVDIPALCCVLYNAKYEPLSVLGFALVSGI